MDGSRRYRIHIPAGNEPDVTAFWSITLYGAGGNLVAKETQRYSSGDLQPQLSPVGGSDHAALAEFLEALLVEAQEVTEDRIRMLARAGCRAGREILVVELDRRAEPASGASLRVDLIEDQVARPEVWIVEQSGGAIDGAPGDIVLDEELYPLAAGSRGKDRRELAAQRLVAPGVLTHLALAA